MTSCRSRISAVIVCAAVLLLSSCRGPAPGSDGALDVGDHEVSLSHDGRDRTYLVHVPSSAGDAAPIVVALHGGGGTAEQFQRESGLDAVADREGFIVVYPDGTGRLRNRLHTWNSGPNCCGFARDNDVDDVGFLLAVIDDLEQRADIDPDRVLMTGHSNGGMMAFRFAAESSDSAAAVVPVAGALSVQLPDTWVATPMLQIHSVDDPRALYEGGETPPFPGTDQNFVAEPVLDGIEMWADRSGCAGEPQAPETDVGASTATPQSVERLQWDCPAGAAVEHLRMRGVGHGWPGAATGSDREDLVGPATELVDAAEEVWAFAERLGW